MKSTTSTLTSLFIATIVFAQNLPPKQAYPKTIKQIHSGHSLTDPLFGQPWPGQFINLIGVETGSPGWTLFNSMIGKSTIPGSSLLYRWNNVVGFDSPDARQDIGEWELLCITERVPLNYEGGNNQQWYLDGIQEQRNYLSQFVNNAWNNGNNGNGTPTLLWTTWTNIDNSNGPWREMLDTQGAEFERMQDHANANRPTGAPHVYLIPGHRMMARLYDDIQSNNVPGISNISDFFSDNIHTNSLGDYAIAMIHYACIFNESPVGLPNNLMPDVSNFQAPTTALATYLQTMIWDVVTNYHRTGISGNASVINYSPNSKTDFLIYPNPTSHIINIDHFDKSNKNIIQIIDMTGKVILTTDDNQIDVSFLGNGIYALEINGIIKKFIKR